MADEANVLQPDASPGSTLSLDEIVGQVEAVQRLKALVELVRSQAYPLPHILLVGRAGNRETHSGDGTGRGDGSRHRQHRGPVS
jgi:Holliday junction resolvasome RuvABC ATP-dependent DNA helicase subunit